METIDLTKNIMDKIEREQIKMRPRSYFVILSIITAALLMGSVLANFLLTNVAIFKLRIYGPLEFLAFGSAGLEALTGSVPWTIIFTSVIFFVLSVIFLKRYDISYKRNFSGLVFVLLFLVIGGSLVLDSTKINENIKKSERLPQLYYGTFKSETWITGEIVKINKEMKQFVVHVPYGNGTVIIQWSDQTVFPKGSDFPVASYIKAIGQQKDGIFYAGGIVSSQHLDY